MNKLIGMAHLKAKSGVDRKARKQMLTQQMNSGHKKMFKKLLAGHVRG